MKRKLLFPASSPGSTVSLNPHDPPPPAFAGHCVNGSQVPPGGWFPANLPEETVGHFGVWRDRGCRVSAATTGGTRKSQVGPPLKILPAFISSTIGSLSSVFHILEFFFRSLASPFQLGRLRAWPGLSVPGSPATGICSGSTTVRGYSHHPSQLTVASLIYSKLDPICC